MTTTPDEVVGRLLGLQAQEPIDPYVALWTRIRAFDPLTLSDGINERRLVRIGLMRTTLHLVTADDAFIAAVMVVGLPPSWAITAILGLGFLRAYTVRG